LTQLARCAELTHISFRNATIDQTSTYWRRGSILGGTITAGSGGFDVRMEIDSDEPPERIQHLVRLAKESCFTHGALAQPVPITTTICLNGQEIADRATV
jgi:hypothetical protein